MRQVSASVKITLNWLYWAAAFLEGEGSFSMRSREGSWKSARVTASQVQKEPLERLVRILGGKVYLDSSNRKNPINRWLVTGPRAVGVMMTVFTIMSPERKSQISKALSVWKQSPPAPQYRMTCPKGHPYSGSNLRLSEGGKHRKCRTCRQEYENFLRWKKLF